MTTLLIQNAHTIATLNDAGDELKDASIFVRHNRIEAIGKAKDLPHTADQVINAQHHVVNIATGLATLEPELEDVLRVLGAKRWDVLVKVGLPRSMPYFFGSLKVAITLAFVGTTVSEMTAANEGIGYLLISAGSAMQMGLAFSGLVVVGAMAMVMYELFSYIEKHTTAWAHRSTNNE